MAVDQQLELLRCPRGCDPQFIQYLEWEGTSLRICDSTRVWVSGDITKGRPGTYVNVYNMGLRCGDCGVWYGRKGVSHETKQALDNLLHSTQNAVRDFIDQLDTDWLRGLEHGTAQVMEENG